jgi:hypothetical protein
MSDLLRLKVEASLLDGEVHLQRLVGGTGKLTTAFPLSPATMASLADETIALLDQFIYRFTKLQDSMGTRLFPSMVSMITGSDDPRPFIDTLNQLEKVGVIPSTETWQTLRVLRNNLAHDYPDGTEQCALTLNMLFVQWHQLEDMFNAAKTYYQKTLLPLLA